MVKARFIVRNYRDDDFFEIMAIQELLCPQVKYSSLAIRKLLNHPCIRCKIIEDDDKQICGVTIYELGNDFYRIMLILINPCYDEFDLNAILLNYLKRKLETNGRNKIIVNISKNDIDHISILVDEGFVCKEFVRNIYIMEYSVGRFSLQNRFGNRLGIW